MTAAVFFALFIALWPAPATATPQISLVTFSPGNIYWQRFGHNALLVREDFSAPKLYNYGVFDFRQKNFFLNFARGQMLYRLDVQPLGGALASYAQERRWAREQVLALDEAQARELADYLAWNALPENAEYRYEYFTQNCSTRVRDALDRTLDGALRRRLEPQATSFSLRQTATRLISPHPALMLGMDAGMGPAADVPQNLWQQAFVPMTLMEALRVVTVGEGATRRNLVQAEHWLLQAQREPEPASAPDFTPWFLATGLALAALLFFWPKGGTVWALLAGTGGVILLLGWLCTDHWVMQANHNLLLLNPLWLLLMPAGWQLGRRPATTWARGCAGVVGLGVLPAPLLVLLPQAQQHTQWLALLLPLNLVVLYRFFRISP